MHQITRKNVVEWYGVLYKTNPHLKQMSMIHCMLTNWSSTCAILTHLTKKTRTWEMYMENKVWIFIHKVWGRTWICIFCCYAYQSEKPLKIACHFNASAYYWHTSDNVWRNNTAGVFSHTSSNAEDLDVCLSYALLNWENLSNGPRLCLRTEGRMFLCGIYG